MNCGFVSFVALIELANLEVNKSDNKLNTITLSNKLNILKHMNHIHCLTVDLPVRIDLKYDIISKLYHQLNC